MTFVNGKSAYTVASPRPVVSGCLNEPNARSLWSSLEPDSILEKGLRNITFKSTAKASPSSYSTRRPQELRFRGIPPWPSVLQGRVRSAMRGTASSGAVTGKREPRLNGTKWQSASSPGRRGFRRDPAVRPVKLREEAHTQGQQKARTGPCPCRGFGRLQTHLPWAPKHSIPASLWNFPLQKGTKEPKKNSPARGPGVPVRPSSERGSQGVQSPVGVRTRRPPTRGPARHSPVWSPRRGGAQAAGSSGALHASNRTPTSLGRCRRRQLGRELRPRALPGRHGGTARSAR